MDCLGQEACWIHEPKEKVFQDRVVNKAGAHIRAFANEMLSAIVLLGLFLDVVVAPMKNTALEDHLACFTLLVCMVAILQKGDIKNIWILRTAMHSHHILFSMLYPECVKTKLHIGQHIADCWEYWGVLLSCFAPERKHKLMKAVMRFAYRRACRTTLAYVIRSWFASLGDEDTFEAVHFVGSVYSVSGAPIIFLPHHGAGTITQWCTKLRMPLGLTSKGDLLRYVSLEGDNGFGIAVGFARLQMLASILFVVAIQVCEPIREPIQGLKHWRRTAQHGLLTSAQVSAAVPYVDFGNSFVPAPHS